MYFYTQLPILKCIIFQVPRWHRCGHVTLHCQLRCRLKFWVNWNNFPTLSQEFHELEYPLSKKVIEEISTSSSWSMSSLGNDDGLMDNRSALHCVHQFSDSVSCPTHGRPTRLASASTSGSRVPLTPRSVPMHAHSELNTNNACNRLWTIKKNISNRLLLE